MARTEPTGLTTTGCRLVLVIAALSIAHHVDHIVREMTGWPLGGGLNPFSASLAVYPLILGGFLLSRRRQVGPRFWAALAGGGAAFVLAVHIGPAAGDPVTAIPDQYGSALATATALVVPALLAIALVAHCLYEIRRMVGASSR